MSFFSEILSSLAHFCWTENFTGTTQCKLDKSCASNIVISDAVGKSLLDTVPLPCASLLEEAEFTSLILIILTFSLFVRL